jgi:hypothetical protein
MKLSVHITVAVGGNEPLLVDVDLEPIMSSDIATSGFRFHVAVDFGTHGSGFAYV